MNFFSSSFAPSSSSSSSACSPPPLVAAAADLPTSMPSNTVVVDTDKDTDTIDINNSGIANNETNTSIADCQNKIAKDDDKNKTQPVDIDNTSGVDEKDKSTEKISQTVNPSPSCLVVQAREETSSNTDAQQSPEGSEIVAFLEQEDGATALFIHRLLRNPTLDEFTDACKILQDEFECPGFSYYPLADYGKTSRRLANLLAKIDKMSDDAGPRERTIFDALSSVICRVFITAIQFYGIWHKETFCMHQLYLLLLVRSNVDFEKWIEPRALELLETVCAKYRTSTEMVYTIRMEIACLYKFEGLSDKAYALVDSECLCWENLAEFFASTSNTDQVEKFAKFLGKTCKRVDEQRRWLKIATRAFSSVHGNFHALVRKIIMLHIDTLPPRDAHACAKVLYKRCCDVLGSDAESTYEAGEYLAKWMIKTGDEHVGNLLSESISNKKKALNPLNKLSFLLPEVRVVQEKIDAKQEQEQERNATSIDQLAQQISHRLEKGFIPGQTAECNLPKTTAEQLEAIFRAKGYKTKVTKHTDQSWSIFVCV